LQHLEPNAAEWLRQDNGREPMAVDHTGRSLAPCCAVLLALALLAPEAAQAQVLVVGNDEKMIWDESGTIVNQAPGKDTVSIYDLKASPAAPKLLASLPLENSILGPPTNIAIAPSGEIALVANSVTQIEDGEDWKPVPDNKIYVIDLTVSPPRPIATIEGGKQPSGMAIDRKGDLALVANREDKSISVLAIAGKDVQVIDTIAMGDSVAAVAITPDGKHAIAVEPIANKIAWLDIDGQKVTYDKVDVVVGVKPYNVAITPDGKIAIVNDQHGGSDGSVDTVAIIDLEANRPRVIDYVVVGEGPEGLAISPKGNLAASLLIRASNGDHKAPYYHKNGSVAVLKINGTKVTKISEVEVGGTPQAIGFSPDGKYLYVGNFNEGDLSIFKVDGTKLVDTGSRMKLAGHPAALGVSPR
jgi:DNA-binding beta-propeller fold protein YncE